MNILPRDKQTEIIAALCEGVGQRAVSRLTGTDRKTIARLALAIGNGCAALHNNLMRDLHVARIELDEAWSYVGKKQRRVTPKDVLDKGDQYVFIALGASSKAILTYCVGKRDFNNTKAFLTDLRARVKGSPDLSSDAFHAYERAVWETFGRRCSYGQIVKKYVGEPAIDAARRYSPGIVVDVERRDVFGEPGRVSTSYVERQNLSLRMSSRRFTRLTNGFSKDLSHHVAAVSLYVAYYNFCRVHEARDTTPAVALGITDHVWSVSELIEAALKATPTPTPAQRRKSFRVIQGDLFD